MLGLVLIPNDSNEGGDVLIRMAAIVIRKLLSPFGLSSDCFSAHFPVSVKAILFIGDQVVLVRNDRNEWELPGGKLARQENPEQCIVREAREELGTSVVIDRLIDAWVLPITPQVNVLILTIVCLPLEPEQLLATSGKGYFQLFPIHTLNTIPLPEGYRRSIQIAFTARNAVT